MQIRWFFGRELGVLLPYSSALVGGGDIVPTICFFFWKNGWNDYFVEYLGFLTTTKTTIRDVDINLLSNSRC